MGRANGVEKVDESTYLAQFNSPDHLLCHLARLGLPWRGHAALNRDCPGGKAGRGGRLAEVGAVDVRRGDKDGMRGRTNDWAKE